MGNVLLIASSLLLLCLTLVYFKRKWPDLDLIDIYLIYIALHFGIYPFIRGFYWVKGVVYDSFNNNPLAIVAIYLQLLLVIIIIRVVCNYLPERIQQYLKIKGLIRQWARVNGYVLLSIYAFLILFQFISYYKYGVKSHIVPDDFERIGKDLPYWFMSVRTIYNYFAIGVIVALTSKTLAAESRARYYWLALLIIFLPFVAYFGRKAFVNVMVIGTVIWLVDREENIFQWKYLKLAGLMLLAFFLVSNIYQTYRSNLMSVGVSLRQLSNPITAALNFKETLKNLKIRPGTWEFSYLVLDRQMQEPGKATTDGKIFREAFKSSIPRIFWPGKKFQITSEVLAETYHANLADVSLGSNFFGVAQSEVGYYSILVLPLVIILIVIMMAALLKMTFEFPVFFWLLSMTVLQFFMYIEENQNELLFMLRNIMGIMAVFLVYAVLNKNLAKLGAKKFVT